MYTLFQIFNEFNILYDYLYIFVMNILFEYWEYYLTKISHQLQVLWIYYFKDVLDLKYNLLTGTLPTETWNTNELGKWLCTHCFKSLMNFSFCMIICIYLLWVYYLNTESVKWPKYLIICKSCDFLISRILLYCNKTS